MAELLLELFSEEIPARMQVRAADDLRQLLADGLTKAGLAHDGGRGFSTPRRLVVVIDGIPDAQPDLAEERKGPRVGSPQPAIDGFLRAAGVASLEQCEKRATDKGEFWFAVTQRKGRPARDVLPAVVTAAVAAVAWPKSMRFGHSTFRWVRPLHRVLCLFDGRPLDGALALDETNILPFCDRSSGHRFLAPDEFPVTGFADLKGKLAAAKVILDPAERAQRIVADAQALAAADGLTLREDAGLLAEVSGLVEWPVVLMGHVDDAFMDVPAEVLVTSMRTHQKYFALDRADGGLAARFVVVANVETADRGQAIVAGNERVLRARLSDAKFFWDQDRRVPLADRAPALDKVVFHAKLGTMGERVARLEGLAATLAASIPGCDAAVARAAAGLAKADLTSGMVGEFPELQGVMGRYYARHDGLAAEIAEAIAQHYSPLGPNDRCPTAPVAVAVALADKIDALVGFFAIDEKPTGSKDPFALRRAALGIIRLIVENRLRLALTPLFDAAIDLYRPTLGDSVPSSVAAALLDFLGDRLKVHLRGEGVRHDLVAAVFGTGGEDDIVRLLARVEALGRFLGSEDGANLLVAYRRASNIVRIEEKKDGPHGGPVDAATLAEPEERALAAALAETSPGVAKAVAGEHYGEAMRLVAGLRGPVDAFFERVTVNAPDAALRANRLRLLSEIRRTLDSVADFSRIEG